MTIPQPVCLWKHHFALSSITNNMIDKQSVHSCKVSQQKHNKLTS